MKRRDIRYNIDLTQIKFRSNLGEIQMQNNCKSTFTGGWVRRGNNGVSQCPSCKK